LAGALAKRILSVPFNLVPEGRVKFWLRTAAARTRASIPPDFLVSAGETVVLVGFHRIDSVMLWSHLVGANGRVILIEAVPEYVENIRRNLEHHLNWRLRNIVYVAKGVDSKRGRSQIQVGAVADYNKLAERAVDDGLTDADYVRQLEVETETIDEILDGIQVANVHHIHMTISGLEVEALKGMPRTLQSDGLRACVRSLHAQGGELLYPKVVEIFDRCGMKTLICRGSGQFTGRDIYAARIERRRGYVADEAR
jgi:FkbM family methyltransferase